MNCSIIVLKWIKGFSLNNKTLKKYWKIEKDTGKVQGILSVQKSGNPDYGTPPSPRGQTKNSENITFPQLCLQAVKNNCSKTVWKSSS